MSAPVSLIIAVDPGTTHSAIVTYDVNRSRVEWHGTHPNDEARALLRPTGTWERDSAVLVVEQVEAMGMAIGREVFETVWWSGRFHEAWGDGTAARVTRRAVKLHLCGSMRAKDANIRQAILDRFGGAAAIGVKRHPGPLYGVKGHEFAALAVALTYLDTVLHAPTAAEDLHA